MVWRQSNIQLQDRAAHALVDDRFASDPPTQQLPWLTWVGVWFRYETPEGRYISGEEEADFGIFEKRLIELADSLAQGWAVYCLRLLSRGIVEFYFYTRDESTLASLVDRFKLQYPEYRVEKDTFPDTEWVEYKKYLSAVS